jgi:hypothetical protein
MAKPGNSDARDVAQARYLRAQTKNLRHDQFTRTDSYLATPAATGEFRRFKNESGEDDQNENGRSALTPNSRRDRQS